MDIGKPLHDYGPIVNIAELRDHMLVLPATFWELDAASRMRLASARKGNAVFFYNDVPQGVMRNPLYEAQSGRISVLRYSDRPLFVQIQAILDEAVAPHFPACDVVRVQLAELPPFCQIPPHHDKNLLAVMHRLHVPIVTHKDVIFMIDGGNYHLEAGNLYDLNNCVPHAVDNNSDVMRIHLLIDMVPHEVARTRYYDKLDDIVRALAV